MGTFKYLMSMVTVLLVVISCEDTIRNAEPLIDPWTRERTPLALTLDGQAGKATISNDWRHDEEGKIAVSLILPDDPEGMKAVEIKELVLQYKATANVQVGSTLDLSSGSAQFTVTAENGEKRVYTVTYEPFTENLEGTYKPEKVKGLDQTLPFAVLGGYDGNVVFSNPNDKSWKWENYSFNGENDNTYSIKLDGIDNEKDCTYGTLLNLAGNDGKYATFIWKNPRTDLGSFYRTIPEGKSRWSKDLKTNVVSIYAYSDTEMTTPLYTTILLESGKTTPTNAEGKTVTIPHYAFVREFSGPYNDYSDTGDGRFQKNNLRDSFTFMTKEASSPLSNHNALLKD